MTTNTFNTVNSRLQSFYNDNVIDSYNMMAKVYDAEYDLCDYNGPRYGAEELARLLGDKKDAKIIDIAAGTGRTVEHLVKRGFTNMDGVDGSEKMRDVAMGKEGLFKKYIVSMVDANPIPGIEDDAYDGLVTVGSFCPGHMPAESVTELYRIVKPGGYIVIVVREQWFFEAYNCQIERLFYNMMQLGKVRRITRKIVPRHFGGFDGLVFSYEVLK